MGPTATEKVKIPDFLANWPWKRAINPNYEKVKAETDAWMQDFRLFKDAKSQDAFDRVETHQLRVGSDLMALFYAYDEHTDIAGEQEVRRLADIVMDGLRTATAAAVAHATTQPGEENSKLVTAGENDHHHPLGVAARQFWTRAIPHLSPTTQRHFLTTFEDYLYSVVDQARVGRGSRPRVPTMDEYWAIRDDDSGCLPSFAMGELGLDLPDHVYSHPLLERMKLIAMRLITAGNDIYSYNLEVLRGTGLFNLVTTVMTYGGEHDGMGETTTIKSPKEAMEWIGEWMGQLLDEFHTLRGQIDALATRESWSEETRRQVDQLVEIWGCWVRGNDDWSFESQRYFGTEGARVRVEREILMISGVEIQKNLKEEDEENSSPGNVGCGHGGAGSVNGRVQVRELMDRDNVSGLRIITKAY